MQRVYVGLRGIFNEDVPQAFVDDWLRQLVNCFKTARKMSERYSPEMAHDTLPHMRRGLIDDALYNLVLRHGGDASRMPNAAENCSHTEGIFNRRTLLTTHSVRTPTETVRSAVFRTGLQREAKQLRFFFMGERVTAADLSHGIYGQLLYGPEERKTGFPAFARIVFPSEHGDVLESIDLTMRLAELAYRKRNEEVIDDNLALGLLPEQKKKEQSGE
jgi:hypothetical protein